MGKNTTVRLDPAAVEDAERLRAGMRAEGVKTLSRDEVVRALVWGVTPPQAVGMLRAYNEHTERVRRGEI